jgi:hypothetical protein
MTRRGSIVYYLGAVVCGCFFLAVSFYVFAVLKEGTSLEDWAKTAIIVYFFTIVFGLFPVLLGAFVLRRTMRALGWADVWRWVASGVGVFLGVLWALGVVGLWVERAYFAPQYQQVKAVLMFLLVGPMMLTTKPFWLPIPAAATTAWVLFLIHRAFEPRGGVQT